MKNILKWYLTPIGIDVETGDVINCLVIDINTKEWLFIGTLIPEVIAIVETGKKAKQKVIYIITLFDYNLCNFPTSHFSGCQYSVLITSTVAEDPNHMALYHMNVANI